MAQPSKDLEYIFERQNELFSFIAKSEDNLRKLPHARRTVGSINTRVERIIDNWNEFKQNHLLLNQHRSDYSETIYFSDDLFSSCEENYTNAKGLMLDMLSDISKAATRSEPVQAAPEVVIPHQRQLPRINLPKFSGRCVDWTQFRDLFVTMIKNDTSLTDVEKFQYLKMSLEKEPARLIKNLSVTHDNFDVAWQILEDRYDNLRVIVEAQLTILLSSKSLRTDSSEELNSFIGEINESIGALEALQCPVEHWDLVLIHILVRKLDSETSKEWERSINNRKISSTFKEFMDFLNNRVLTLEAIERLSTKKKSFSVSSGSAQKPSSFKSHNVSVAVQKCFICNGDHSIFRCDNFLTKSPKQRSEFVIQNKRCFNCLGNHYLPDCRVATRCKTCSKRHHTILHEFPPEKLNKSCNSNSNKNNEFVESKVSVPGTSTSHQVNTFHLSSSVLLATALVRVKSVRGDSLLVRALIDQGSEVSFVSEALVQRLSLPRKATCVPINGVGSTQTCVSNGTTSVNIISKSDNNVSIVEETLILPKLTSYIPKQEPKTIPVEVNSLDLADPEFYSNRRIDLILGVKFYSRIILNNIRKFNNGFLVAQETLFGWILFGHVSFPSANSERFGFQCSVDRELLTAIQKFWKIEDDTNSTQKLASDDLECENHFINTHSRDVNGRFVVRLPFRRPSSDLGSSRHVAVRSFGRMEQRFAVNEKLFLAYRDFMHEYLTLGHMSLVSLNPNNTNYYLPHHGVVRESSSTTKLRVVFNGSAVTSSGLSLNDCLHVGPKLQAELVDVLLRWRRHKIVFSCDIEKMYRQINVHPNDRSFQRIVWRDSSDKVIENYELNTVTYGLSCAPFLAIRCLHHLADQHSTIQPSGSVVLKKDTYVDDILSGAETIEEVKTLINQTNSILTAGGFHARKWISNQASTLENLPRDDVSMNDTIKFEDESEFPRALGLLWNNKKDEFLFNLSVTHTDENLTKRSVLSFIAKLFDPLGLLSPFIITAKIFMQELWVLGLDWDDELPEDLAKRWQNFQKDLLNVTTISIPRWFGIDNNKSNIQIHGFSDASTNAYAAVAYIRVETLAEVRVVLISSKTKVAPLKVVSIPRLELCAAVVLSRLVHRIRSTLEFENFSTYLWTDSTVALSWIRSHPNRWKDFVRNRVIEIQELSQAKWSYVPGSDNPADLASRGVPINKLQQQSIWWSGPSWLQLPSSDWPSLKIADSVEADREIKRTSSSHHIAIQTWNLKEKYSTLNKLIRVTSWCFRFINKSKNSNVSGNLTPEELEKSLLFWVKEVQKTSFREEIQILLTGKSISKSSSIYRLTPFIDGHGLLRITGRLQFSVLNWDEKHPMILPKDDPFTKLIIDAHHRRVLHGGTQLTLSSIRRRFWIVGGRSPVRSFIHQCIVCARQRAKTSQQMMGQLPPSRVTPSRPFLHSGVDYAGPFILKTHKGRGHKTYKSYLILFVCLVSSAIHLEISTDYTTNGFIAAYKRFTGRRGLCQCLYSDCGTNLIGADRELRSLFSSASKEWNHLINVLSNDGTRWRFNPPSAPHFGGKWEAGVRSVKTHLRKIMGSTVLTYEEFTTVLIQIEAVLNSRPLCPVSNDPTNFEFLCPAHFLIGSSLSVVPEPSLLDETISRLNRYQFLRRLIEEFWKHWKVFYLQSLQNRNKWHQEKNLPKVGSLVLIKDERLPPSKWTTARVLELHPGADNRVRVATIKTPTTTLVRPIVKLCSLPG